MFSTYHTRTAPAEAAEARAAIASAHTHLMAVDAAEGDTARRRGIHATISQARVELRAEQYNTAKHTAQSAITL